MPRSVEARRNCPPNSSSSSSSIFTRRLSSSNRDFSYAKQFTMSAQDMRDMLGLTGDVARPPPLKKQKTVEKRARMSHLSITGCAAC
ncbi:unnamed protein product [Aureobasidium uvarum]|uniref:Uncharacterized protein n=1 Tax=Aureobasidium uvarum TaxID=2773716 RepID=A0A9N8KIB3_9PEZI|nr:unnamed protein product [Aureobasidium uvarum]